MTTATLSPATLAGAPVSVPLSGPALSARPGFWKRFLPALIASREAKAEREIRRLESMLGRSLREPHAGNGPNFDHALLPFRGE
jgi:hypothetical protein